MPVEPRVKIEGVRELRAALKAAGGPELVKQLGQVHKRIGGMVIAAAGGPSTGVGEGAGATIRPSAATREVQVRVGGGHRDSRRQQWGRRQVFPGGEAPHRPHLIGAALSIQDQIEEEYLRGVETIIKNVGLDT